MKYRVLLAEDDKQLCKMLEEYLRNSGYDVVAVNNGKEALSAFGDYAPHLVILDVQIPGVSGIEVCRQLRSKADVPIIMATALTADADRINGLETGADDYLAKPFHPRELLIRIGNLLRRCYERKGSEKTSPSRLVLDSSARLVRIDGIEVKLTPTEFKIAEALISNETRALNRTNIANYVLGCSYDGCERTIDAHVKRIRTKFTEIAPDTEFIATIRGYGYRVNLKGGTSENKIE